MFGIVLGRSDGWTLEELRKLLRRRRVRRVDGLRLGAGDRFAFAAAFFDLEQEARRFVDTYEEGPAVLGASIPPLGDEERASI